MSDLLLAGARLPGTRDLVDLHLRDGAVAAVTPAGTSPSADVERIELDGRWVLPGLWDNHVHFSQWAASSRRLDVGGAGSAVEAVALVRAALAAPGAAASDDVLVGYGFRDGLWADLPSAMALDAVSGPRPVVLVSGDLHCCWLNTAALARFGVTGHPDGVLREEPAFAVHRALDDVPPETLDAWALDAARAAAARGVVGIVDLEMAWNLEVWQRRAAAGHDLLRVEFGVYPQHLERAIAAGLRTGQRIAPLVSVGPAKFITDGSLNTRTAYCFDEYPGLEGQPNAQGLLTVAPEELLALLQRASGAGFVPAVHAIGDHANRLALDAFEALGPLRPPATASGAAWWTAGTLEHAQLLAEADVPRFAALGVTASVQPEHAMDDRDVAERYWPGRTDRAFALGALRAAGAELALGSDAPVAPLDPWVSIAAAVSRSRDDRAPWHPEQRIPVAAALAASTRGRGAIRVGDSADLVVTELDPLAATPEQLPTMPVALTLLAGRPIHRAL